MYILSPITDNNPEYPPSNRGDPVFALKSLPSNHNKFTTQYQNATLTSSTIQYGMWSIQYDTQFHQTSVPPYTVINDTRVPVAIV